MKNILSRRAWHGFLLGLAAYATYNLMDVFIKKLSALFPVYQIIFMSFMLSMPILYAFSRWRGGRDCMRTRAPVMQVLRGILFFIYTATAWYGLEHLPLADFYTFIFTTPLFATVFAVLWLREKVSAQQIGLIVLSFIGVIVAFQPDLSHINFAALVVVAGTIAGGLGQVMVRRLSADEGLGASLIYPELATAFTALAFGFSEFIWPDENGWMLFAAAAVLCGIANAVLVLAFYMAPASQVAPTQYSQIIWGTILGFLVFGDVPNEWIIIGAVIIVGAGIGLARLEHRATHG